MLINKPLIEETIRLSELRNDPVQSFATRNKASPIDFWFCFVPFTRSSFNLIYNQQIDGVKLKFRNDILTFNGRHSLT